MTRRRGTIDSMGFHPANLTFRFLLEITSLIGIFRLGLSVRDGYTGWAWGSGLTLLAMILWATFRVPGDESAKGDAPYAISGPLRIVLELLIFGLGTYGWFVSGPARVAWVNLAGLVAHHALSYDRFAWLLAPPQRNQGQT